MVKFSFSGAFVAVSRVRLFGRPGGQRSRRRMQCRCSNAVCSPGAGRGRGEAEEGRICEIDTPARNAKTSSVASETESSLLPFFFSFLFYAFPSGVGGFERNGFLCLPEVALAQRPPPWKINSSVTSLEKRWAGRFPPRRGPFRLRPCPAIRVMLFIFRLTGPGSGRQTALVVFPNNKYIYPAAGACRVSLPPSGYGIPPRRGEPRLPAR